MKNSDNLFQNKLLLPLKDDNTLYSHSGLNVEAWILVFILGLNILTN